MCTYAMHVEVCLIRLFIVNVCCLFAIFGLVKMLDFFSQKKK